MDPRRKRILFVKDLVKENNSLENGRASKDSYFMFFLLLHSAKVMMVVQPGERNAFDQRYIEYNLLKK